MPTRLENIMRVRTMLDTPYPNNPSFANLMRQEISEEMDVVNATLESGMPWATETYQLNYQVGVSTYEINVSDWGKVLYVVRNTNSPYIPFVNVPFDDVNMQHFGTIWGDWSNNWGALYQWNDTAERMSFYRSGVVNAQFMLKINPLPQQSWTYYITYIPGYIGDSDPLSSAIQMPEHAELVRLRMATALLPYTKWYEDEDANSNKRKELAQSFAFQLSRKETLFANYIRNINIPKMVFVDDWNN